MHDYLFTAEVVRFAFMFGVAVSMVLYERKHLTTGSIVVPGYIATFLTMPTVLVATFANAFVSYFLINKLLRRWFLLYGRTKFTVLAVTSIVIQTLMLKLSPSGAWAWESDIKLLVGVGYVVPALIAHDMGRQGIKKTFRSVLLAGVIVAVPIALALAVAVPGINDLAPLRGGSDTAIDVAWIPIAVLLSAAAAWGVARFWGLRSGGFMGAAFVAILLGDPWQVVVIAALAATTYVLVTRFLMNSMILFGRRKFSAMLLISASMSWVMLWVGGEVFGIGVQRHMDVGSLALTPLIVPGLLANDAQRTSPARVLGGLSLATTFVLSMTWWLEALVEGRPLDLGWKVTATLTALTIFGRTTIEQLLASARAANEARRAARGRTPAAVGAGAVHDHWYDFAFASYHRWAALHAEASAAAEHWLSTMLGEAPALALAGDRQPAPLPQPNDRSLHMPLHMPHLHMPHLHMPHVHMPQMHMPHLRRQDTAVGHDEPATGHNTVSQTIARMRHAAELARHAPAETGPIALPVRRKPLPVRRPRVVRGEFDAVAAEIAGLTTPRNDSAIAAGLVAPPAQPLAPILAHPDAAASLPSRPLPAAGSPISEPSGAATTRAHQRAAPDARGTSTTHRSGSDEGLDLS